MEMIDLYVNEVTQRLPQKMRDDIGKELRSLIEDTLEDESQAQGRPVDTELVVTVLKRLGPPAKVAASYLPPRYLIGPQLFPHYLNTLRIVVPLVIAVTIIILGISLAVSPDAAQTLPDLLAEIIGGLIGAVFQAFTWVTIVYAIFQATSADLNSLDRKQEWDPRQMKPQPDEDRIKIGEVVAEILFTVLALVVFNVYPEWLGLTTSQGGEWIHIPLLTAAFFRYLPFLSAIWAVEIGRDMALLGRGRWTPALRWFSLAISAATITIAALMLTGPSIVAIDAAAIGRMGWGTPTPADMQTISTVIEIAARITLATLIATELFQVGKHLYRLFIKEPIPAFEI